MYFKQFYLGCLAHASYLVGSDGKAAVVDPRRDVDEYLAEAETQGLPLPEMVEIVVEKSGLKKHYERRSSAAGWKVIQVPYAWNVTDTFRSRGHARGLVALAPAPPA